LAEALEVALEVAAAPRHGFPSRVSVAGAAPNLLTAPGLSVRSYSSHVPPRSVVRVARDVAPRDAAAGSDPSRAATPMGAFSSNGGAGSTRGWRVVDAAARSSLVGRFGLVVSMREIGRCAARRPFSAASVEPIGRAP